jgi:hypothetical protein
MPKELWFDSEQEWQIFVLSVVSTLAQRSIWPFWGVLGAKCLGHEADLPHLSSAEVKNELSSTSPPTYAFMIYAGTAIKTSVFYLKCGA